LIVWHTRIEFDSRIALRFCVDPVLNMKYLCTVIQNAIICTRGESRPTSAALDKNAFCKKAWCLRVFPKKLITWAWGLSLGQMLHPLYSAPKLFRKYR